jgi:biotin operon repressor
LETLRKYFNKFLKLDDSEWKDFESCISKVNIANKEQILKKGFSMNFIHQIEKFQKLNTLIEQEKTGTPKEFAQKLKISKSKLYELMDDLKSFGVEIKYSRKVKTFYYVNSSKLDINFSFRPFFWTENHYTCPHIGKQCEISYQKMGYNNKF